MHAAVKDEGAAHERLALFRNQTDADACFIVRKQGTVRESGEMQAPLARALAGVQRVAFDQRSQSAGPLQGELRLLDPEIGRLDSQTRSELFQTHRDDGLVEFLVEMHLGHRAGHNAAEDERRLALLHAGRIGETDFDLRPERIEVVEIHPRRSRQSDDGEKPRPRNTASPADNLSVVLWSVHRPAQARAPRHIMRIS